MLSFLRPSPTLTDQEVERSLRMMRWVGVANGALLSLGSGGFMAAYALALGATNAQVGILAALPFLTQVIQLPAILLIERFRARKALGIPSLLVAQLLWAPIGVIPLLLDTPGALAVAVVIGLMALRGLFLPVWTTALTSWTRDLVPQNILGSYYARRLATVTTAVAVVALGGSFFVSWWQDSVSAENAILAYSFLLIGGAFTLGLAGPLAALRAREPLMPAAPESGQSAIAVLLEPLRHRNFSHVVRFLFVWSLTSNLAIPFFAVYMLSELGLSLPTVIGFTVLSQITNVLFVRVWGPMADRVGSKTVLSLSASLYLLVILGWVFTTHPERHVLTFPLLAVLHIFAGVAAAGVTLTINTLGLKVAPRGEATSFLGLASIATNTGAGIGPIIGGVMADFFAGRSLGVDLNWTSMGGVVELSPFSLSGFDFLFVIAFVASLLSLNLLVALREEGEVPRDVALAELVSSADPAARAISSVPGLGSLSAFSYGYLKRVPGADVALGVTAYQLAASTRTAVASASRGRLLVRSVANAVGGALEKAIDEFADVAGHGLEAARHATRGAVQVGDDLADFTGDVVRGAVLGTVRALADRKVAPRDALRGAGYGAVQGSIEAGRDPAEAAAQAVAAARDVAPELGMAADEAAIVVAAGALDAAAASDEEALAAVMEALPSESTQLEADKSSNPDGSEGRPEDL